MAGTAICSACHHEWLSVAPTGTMELECPECSTMKGRFKFDCAPPEGTLSWTCNCGNQLFNVLEDGIFCPNCGNYQTFPS